MGKRVDADRLMRVSKRLGDAAVDPAIWPEIMQEICTAAGARGAVLLQADVRTSDVPRTASVDEYVQSYFAEGWHMRDIRAERCVPRLMAGEKVLLDQDIVTPDEIRRVGLYRESLVPHGLQWFAAVGFRAGAALWGLTIQRTNAEGSFSSQDKGALSHLSDRLSETATLSKAVGQAALAGMTNALDLIGQPALAIDRLGCVLDANASAQSIFGDQFGLRNRRLCLCDAAAKAALDRLIERMQTTPDTDALGTESIVVRRRGKRPLLVRVLPVAAAARGPFLGARALLTVMDLQTRPAADCALLAQAFGLSPAEARLAALVATGASPAEAAAELGIVRETARNQLKAVFVKTDTHRQSELVALLARTRGA